MGFLDSLLITSDGTRLRCWSIRKNAMNTDLNDEPFRSRPGFMRIELVVAVILCVLFLTLISPGINDRRGPSRRTECLNNLKCLALAVNNYAANYNGAVPYLVDGTDGWPIVLLPYLDASETAQALRDPKLRATAKNSSLKIFQCPRDKRDLGVKSRLSYVANSGYGRFVINSNSGAVSEIGAHPVFEPWPGMKSLYSNEPDRRNAHTRAIIRSTGVFWRADNDGFQMTLDDIGRDDGVTNTLLFTENLNAGPWHSTKTMDLAFVIGLNSIRFDHGKTKADYSPLRIQSIDLKSFAINANQGTLLGSSPAPSSVHSGQVMAAFCDGRAKAISEKIDPAVYARMMSSNGQRLGQRIDDNW